MWVFWKACVGQQAYVESLGFVVWMLVILVLASFSLGPIYRVVFTLGREGSREDLRLPATAGGQEPQGIL